METLLGLLIAIIAYLSLAFGFVLQKKGIKFKNWTDRFIWIAGFIFMNLTPVFNFFALKTLPSSIVSAAAGISVPFTIFLARIILKSSVKKTDYLYSLLMMLAIFISNYFQPDTVPESFSSPIIYIFVFLPFFLFILYIILSSLAKIKFKPIAGTLLYAFCAGGTGGFMMVLLKILQLERGMAVSNYLTSIYLYFYLFLGIFSFIAIQMAYRSGEILVIAPVQYGSNVFYPILGFYLIFSAHINMIQILMFCIIIGLAIKMVLDHKNLY